MASAGEFTVLSMITKLESLYFILRNRMFAVVSMLSTGGPILRRASSMELSYLSARSAVGFGLEFKQLLSRRTI